MGDLRFWHVMLESHSYPTLLKCHQKDLKFGSPVFKNYLNAT